jgi:succinate dehydrogenase hydrophobic anchor subunit
MLEWLGGLPFALLLQRSGTLYLLVNAAHIAGLGLLVGTIVSLDLRMLGAFRAVPLAVLAPFLSRMAASGLALAILTGFLLFCVRPVEYAANPAFLAKLALVLLGILNALWLHAGHHWRGVLSDARVSSAARLHALASLMLWLGAVVAGRWIGFL